MMLALVAGLRTSVAGISMSRAWVTCMSHVTNWLAGLNELAGLAVLEAENQLC